MSEQIKLKRGHILGLRTNAADLSSYGGFQWKESGIVTAPDWDDSERCGNGLHFLPWGIGDAGLLYKPDLKETKWLIVSTLASKVIDLGGKSKAPKCEVVYCGGKEGAIKLLEEYAPIGSAISYGTATAGDCGTATAGDGGTATAGRRGTATAGDSGTATAGDSGTATAGYRGTATAGYRGTATAGYRGTATAGDGGTATAGYGGTATAGYGGTATAGCRGTATAGELGVISIEYYVLENNQYKRLIGYVSEDGLKPGVAYKINDHCEFEEVTT